MKPKEINFQICRNLGNYETVRYSITVEVEDDEPLDFEPLKIAVDEQHRKLFHVEQSEKKKELPTPKKIKKQLDYSEDPQSEFQRVLAAFKNGTPLVKILEFYDISPESLTLFT